MQRCRKKKASIYGLHFFCGNHMIFIDLKVYNKVHRNVMRWVVQKHKVSTKYITLIKDMYDNVVISVQISDEDTKSQQSTLPSLRICTIML
jgi:hypothetical protein